MRILVTGPRQWTDEKTLHDALFSVFIAHAPFTDAEVILVHGGADGFDLISAAKATGLGWQTEEHKADWASDRYLAGFMRNAEMVAAGADACVAGIMDCIKPGCKVPKPHPTHGTADCISRVLLAAIPLVPVYPGRNGIND